MVIRKMLLGRETKRKLQRDLTELRTTLSERITAIYTVREQIRIDAENLLELKEFKEAEEFLSPNFIEKLEADPRILEIKEEANRASGLEKTEELTQLFIQADEMSATIFADGMLVLHAKLLDGLKSLLIQGIKDILNNYYFIKYAESNQKILNILIKAESKPSVWLGGFLVNNTDELKQISIHIKEVKQQIEALFALNQKIPELLHPKIICFNDQANRAELYFSKVFETMSLPDLITCANEAMWATAQMGYYNSHEVLSGLHEKRVGDKSFFDYLRCEKWSTGYGYYYLTTVPEAKNLLEKELTRQEREEFQKYRMAVNQLQDSAAAALRRAESNLHVAESLQVRVNQLRAEIISEISSEVLVNKHEGKRFPKREKIIPVEVPLMPLVESPVAECKQPALEAEPTPVKPVEMAQDELVNQLLAILQSVLSNENIVHCWSKLVWQTGPFWNWRIAVDGVKYAVPTGISYARAELDKLSQDELNKVQVVTKVCQALKNRMIIGAKFSNTLYSAVAEFVDGEKLLITEAKLKSLIKELISNGILTEDPTAKQSIGLKRSGSGKV